MKKIFNAVFAVLCLVSVINTYFLHDATERLKTIKKDTTLEIYQELDSIAWEYNVSPNKTYVTDVKRYYKCDVIKKRIEQEIR